VPDAAEHRRYLAEAAVSVPIKFDLAAEEARASTESPHHGVPQVLPPVLPMVLPELPEQDAKARPACEKPERAQ